MVCTNGTLSGSTRTFNLTANTGYIDTPDGNSILMWSYSVDRRALPEPGPGALRHPG